MDRRGGSGKEWVGGRRIIDERGDGEAGTREGRKSRKEWVGGRRVVDKRGNGKARARDRGRSGEEWAGAVVHLINEWRD